MFLNVLLFKLLNSWQGSLNFLNVLLFKVLHSWQGSSNVSKCFIGISGILNLVEYKGKHFSYLDIALNSHYDMI